jgi:putative spermidine/putrescine transport system substrate-binding protein
LKGNEHPNGSQKRLGRKEIKNMTYKLSIKGFLVGLVIVFTALSVYAADKELVIQTWGGETLKGNRLAFYDQFEKETGIKIVTPTAGGDLMGRVASQVRSKNVEWDIVWPADIGVVEDAANKGLLEAIDYNIVKNNLKDMVPGSVTKYGLGHELSSIVVTYNTKLFPGDNHPNSWAGFYDPVKFPGPRANDTNWAGPVYSFFSALLADGVPPDKLVPIDYQRAFKVLDRIKPHVKVWYQSGDKVMQVLIDQEVVMAKTTDMRSSKAIDLGAQTAVVWNQALAFINYVSVVKGAPHKQAAWQFFNFYTQPKLQAKYMDYMKVSTCNPKGIDHLSPTEAKKLLLYPDNYKKSISTFTTQNTQWLIDHQAEMLEKWNAWLTK